SLSAGSIAFDGDAVALRPFLGEWTWTDRTYPQRSDGLRTPVAGTGQSVKLDANTVFQELSSDVPTGSAGQDWLITNVQVDSGKDRSTDLSAAEFATDLVFLLS